MDLTNPMDLLVAGAFAAAVAASSVVVREALERRLAAESEGRGV